MSKWKDLINYGSFTLIKSENMEYKYTGYKNMEYEHFLLRNATSLPNADEANLRLNLIPINSTYMTKTATRRPGGDDDDFESSIYITCGWSNSFLT